MWKCSRASITTHLLQFPAAKPCVLGGTSFASASTKPIPNRLKKNAAPPTRSRKSRQAAQ
jgi:hypothetical protein